MDKIIFGFGVVLFTFCLVSFGHALYQIYSWIFFDISLNFDKLVANILLIIVLGSLSEVLFIEARE